MMDVPAWLRLPPQFSYFFVFPCVPSSLHLVVADERTALRERLDEVLHCWVAH